MVDASVAKQLVEAIISNLPEPASESAYAPTVLEASLGSTRAWFEQDATDARDWLCRHGVIDAGGRLTGAVRSR